MKNKSWVKSKKPPGDKEKRFYINLKIQKRRE